MDRLTREVTKLPGIQSVRLVMRRKLATVVYDPAAVTAEAVIAAIDRANEEMRKANELG